MGHCLASLSREVFRLRVIKQCLSLVTELHFSLTSSLAFRIWRPKDSVAFSWVSIIRCLLVLRSTEAPLCESVIVLQRTKWQELILLLMFISTIKNQ
jgi:hypothetical protein